MTDKATKILLAAIALGLWLNAVNPWIRPLVVWADAESSLSSISSNVNSMETDLGRIARGVCTNSKIC